MKRRRMRGEQLTSLAATYLKKRAKTVRIENAIVKSGTVETPLAAILKDLGDIEIIGRGARNPNTSEYHIRTFGAEFAQVAVDIETGEIRLERLIAAHDSGRILNPLTVSSQIEGGVLQAMGFALLEGRVLDASGTMLNASLEGYHIPTIADAPRIETHMIDRADPLANNLGVKGVGEPPIIPTPAAIANAIYHAMECAFTIRQLRGTECWKRWESSMNFEMVLPSSIQEAINQNRRMGDGLRVAQT